jgi:hypothetical protein
MLFPRRLADLSSCTKNDLPREFSLLEWRSFLEEIGLLLRKEVRRHFGPLLHERRGTLRYIEHLNASVTRQKDPRAGLDEVKRMNSARYAKICN